MNLGNPILVSMIEIEVCQIELWFYTNVLINPAALQRQPVLTY